MQIFQARIIFNCNIPHSHASSKKEAEEAAGHHGGIIRGWTAEERAVHRTYKGKRILLKAADIYGRNKVPEGEEDFNFLYVVTDIDDTFASIEYEGRYIKDGADNWRSYPAIDESDFVMDNYRLACFKDDHLRYNKYLGVVKKKENDAAQKAADKLAEEAKSSLDNIDDLRDKIMADSKVDKFELLKDEFKAIGELILYISDSGKDAGKQAQKQLWSEFMLNCLL